MLPFNKKAEFPNTNVVSIDTVLNRKTEKILVSNYYLKHKNGKYNHNSVRDIGLIFNLSVFLQTQYQKYKANIKYLL